MGEAKEGDWIPLPLAKAMREAHANNVKKSAAQWANEFGVTRFVVYRLAAKLGIAADLQGATKEVKVSKGKGHKVRIGNAAWLKAFGAVPADKAKMNIFPGAVLITVDD